MSESGDSSQGSSYTGSQGGSSVGSDNTDVNKLNALGSGANGDEADDLEENKSFREAIYATLYTLTQNRELDTSLRLAVIRVIAEFLQLFRVAFNSSFPWNINKNLWIFKVIQWLAFRFLLIPKGYDSYIKVFYVLAGVILACLVATVWVALVMKGENSNNPWVRRVYCMGSGVL
eukprot:GHRR01037236.1.p1 GENE.GHRR01037236.1~~GHRR01037236.1.p1  ORF type:complete len:175 (+),score=39.48 GHRR01037236.1:508-1032(+)